MDAPPRTFDLPVPRRALWGGVAAGTAYGVLVRVALAWNALSGVFLVMSIAFIAVVPAVMGYLTVRPHPRPSLTYRIFAPWIPAVVASGSSMLIGLEGSICVVMGLPLIVLGASLGGCVGGLRALRSGRATAAAIVLPFVLGGVESRLPAPLDVHRVVTHIDIHATPERVWSEFVSVREIDLDELPNALYLRLGFPRPLSAEIDRAGIGAVRHARFAGGVEFVETVDEWDPPRQLGFEIAANTEQIPPTTLDPHVTIGGPYFDVLHGRYQVVPIAADAVRLVLSSELRVSTHFNGYATLWVDRIMASIQRTILAVEKVRAERAPVSA